MTVPSTPQPASEIREHRMGAFTVSTDRARLDLDAIHRFLSTAFWDTEGLPRAVLERGIEHSLCFGVYEGDRQVGFARVVTDRATFAFVCDDFVVESHRGRGLATWLMRCILEHPDLRGLHRVLLVTRDARLYAKAGFRLPEPPDLYMERKEPHGRGGVAADPAQSPKAGSPR